MKYLQNLIFLLCLLCVPLALLGKHKHSEKEYQLAYAATLPNAQVEVVAPDGTRCDILTAEFAIEVDFGKKWAEAIGQSLNYAMQFNKTAGILLILEDSSDYKYYIRLNSIVAHFKLPIKVWTISADAIGKSSTQETATGDYWLSSSGKRHNANCRYYKSGNGKTCESSDGIPCKICGG